MLSKPDISRIRSLAHKKFRWEYKEFIIEGVKMVEELLLNPSVYKIKRLFVRENLFPTPACIQAEYVTENEMARITSLTSPSPALAVVSIPDPVFIEPQKEHLYIALDGIRDPGNFGTILRLADWFDIKAVYASEDCVELYNPKTVQATMGALLRVPVCYTSLPRLFSDCGMPVAGTLLQGGENIYNIPLPDSGFIVLGSESHGISSEVVPLLTCKLFIPSYRKGSESLNVATAAAITCAMFRKDAPPAAI